MAGGVSPPQRESPLSHGVAVPAPPEGKPRALRSFLAPRIYEGGGPRSGRGSPPPQQGRPSQSRLRRASSPRGEAEGAARQLSQRESQGGCAPFLPPAFMRGEGHAVAGGVPPRRGRPSRSRFVCQLSQRESQGCCAPFLPPAFMRGEGHAVAGGVPPPQRGRPSQSRFACQLSQRESQGRCAPFFPPAFMRGEGHAAAGGVSPPLNSHPNFSHSKSIKICIFPIYELKIML